MPSRRRLKNSKSKQTPRISRATKANKSAANSACTTSHLNEYNQFQLSMQGMEALRLGQLEHALSKFDQAVALAPDNDALYNGRAQVKAAMGRYEEAIEEWDRAIALKPELPGAFYSRGLAKHCLQQYDEAISDYNQSLALRPNRLEVSSNRERARKYHAPDKAPFNKKEAKSMTKHERRVNNMHVGNVSTADQTFWDEMGLQRVIQFQEANSRAPRAMRQERAGSREMPLAFSNLSFELFPTWECATFSNGLIDRTLGWKLQDGIKPLWFQCAEKLQMQDASILCFETGSTPKAKGKGIDNLVKLIISDALHIMQQACLRPFMYWASDTELMIAAARPTQNIGPWTAAEFQAEIGPEFGHFETLEQWSNAIRELFEPGISKGETEETTWDASVLRAPKDEIAALRLATWNSDEKTLIGNLVRLAHWKGPFDPTRLENIRMEQKLLGL